MAAILLTSATLNDFVRRIESINPESKRKWGTLEPAGMFAHLTWASEISLEEIHSKDVSTMFKRHILKRLVFQTPLPWPKGKIKAPPEFTPAPKGSLGDERARLIAAMKRFVEAADREPGRKTLHPIFGPFTLKYWQLSHGKHFNHHLDQFGV